MEKQKNRLSTKVIRKSSKLRLAEVVDKLLIYDQMDQSLGKKIIRKYGESLSHPFEILTSPVMKKNYPGALFTSMESLVEWYASKVGLDYIYIDPLKIQVESAVKVIPYAYAKRLQVLPLEVSKDSVLVATSEPNNLAWKEEMSSVLKKKVDVVLASPNSIRKYIDEFFVVQKEIRKLSKSSPRKIDQLLRDGNVKEANQLMEQKLLKEKNPSESAVVKIVDWLFQYAFSERASDIHIEPKRGIGQIRFRVDGKLRVVYNMEPGAMKGVVARVKILSKMKLDEKRKPQDGRIRRYLGDTKVEFRVSALPTAFGEKIVLRIFDQDVAKKSLELVGFNSSDFKKWKRIISSNQGLVLVTGPTGSGKTSTLYSSLNEVATSEKNICTIEEPIEVFVDSFNQLQIDAKINLTFAGALRSILRQDPDVVMVGEIRDEETAQASIQASQTGHLVFSTLHTNGAIATIDRLRNLSLPDYLINSSLKAILAQRLVRKLCPHCKEKEFVNIKAWKNLCQETLEVVPDYIYRPKGCHECKQSGYLGRVCIYELLEITDEVRKAISDSSDFATLKALTKNMFIPFRKNCIRKVRLGETSMEEIISIIY